MNDIPLYDLWCKSCSAEEEDVMKGMDETYYCSSCDQPMINRPGIGSFELKYDPKKDSVDWYGNSTQYYREYKEARARGENVKPSGEET